MNRLKKLLVIFLLFPTSQCLAQHVLLNDHDELSGWLKLQSNFPIHQIWVDSMETSIAPDYLINLPDGVHFIQARAENFENWYLRDAADTVKIVANDTLEIYLSFLEYKVINSDPYGANVWANEEWLGQTPIYVNKIELENLPIKIEKVGYQDTILQDLASASSSIMIELHIDREVHLQQAQSEHLRVDRQIKRQKLALLTFGVGLATGSAAYLLKKKADRTYDNYRIAGNPAEIDRLYNRTKQYDRLAAGSYIVFEINLLASAYFFFGYLLNKD